MNAGARRVAFLFAAGSALVWGAVPAAAHHSFAMYNMNKTTVLQGSVKQLQWKNPHSTLVVAVQAKGKPEAEWWIEMGSIGRISRGGWRKDTVKPGDKITVEINPQKDGTNSGGFINAVLPDGRRLGQTGGAKDIPAPGGDEEGLKQAEREDQALRATH